MVHVAGKTLVETRLAIEKQLVQFFDSPQVAVNVAGYNSMKYYIVFEGSSEGEDVITLPITGKETVLDAISYRRRFETRLEPADLDFAARSRQFRLRADFAHRLYGHYPGRLLGDQLSTHARRSVIRRRGRNDGSE